MLKLGMPKPLFFFLLSINTFAVHSLSAKRVDSAVADTIKPPGDEAADLQARLFRRELISPSVPGARARTHTQEPPTDTHTPAFLFTVSLCSL